MPPLGVALDGAGNLFIVDYGSGSVLEVPAGGGSRLPWSRDYAAAWASDDPIASAFLAIAYENAGSAGEGGGSAQPALTLLAASPIYRRADSEHATREAAALIEARL